MPFQYKCHKCHSDPRLSNRPPPLIYAVFAFLTDSSPSCSSPAFLLSADDPFVAAGAGAAIFFFLTMLDRSLTGADEEPAETGANACEALVGSKSGSVVEGRGAVRRSSIYRVESRYSQVSVTQ